MGLALSQQIPPAAKTTPIHWCLYARKSSEQDERQALSIDQQIKEMLLLADHWGIEIAEIRKESHSSKESGTRPIYNRLIKDIQLGYFNGIVTWTPDRLSRNAGDLGILVDLMDQGKLTEIRTHGQTFTNSPNEKFLLMILGSQAKLENDNLMHELLKLIDKLELDEIGAQEQFKDELELYQRFNGVLGQSDEALSKQPAIDLKAYAKYVLKNGTREEKREILRYVNGELFLKDQKVYIERKPRSKKFN